MGMGKEVVMVTYDAAQLDRSGNQEHERLAEALSAA
jgi:hypothetical protein